MTRSKDVFFISGSMFGEKSKFLINFIEIVHKDNMSKYLVFKPTKDNRDGLYVKSRVHNKIIPALAWDQNYKDIKTMFRYTIAGFSLTNPDENKYVFFDEIHFLSLDEVKFIVKTCEEYGIKLIIAGLETSFKFEYFEASKWLKDNFISVFYHGRCNGCSLPNAVYNVLYDNDGNIVRDGETIQPGSEEYKVLCEECFSKL